jgi:geranylgeranyl diphosphate synthase type I
LVTTWDPTAFRDQVQGVLDAFLDDREAELAPLGPDAGRLIAEARTAVRGGKRFRAAFCHWGHRAIRPDVADELALARACASLEVLHASALVHDDYMDASDTRRGRPATHRAFEAEHRAAATLSSTAPPPRSCSATCSSGGPRTCCAAAASQPTTWRRG